MSDRDQYRETEVDIEASKQLVRTTIGHWSRPPTTHRYSTTLTDVDGFSGLYSLHAGRFKNPVLISSTDGIDAKLKIASMMCKHDTVGIELVGMEVNDIVLCGARPCSYWPWAS